MFSEAFVILFTRGRGSAYGGIYLLREGVYLVGVCNFWRHPQ